MPLYCHLYIIHSSKFLTCLSRYFAHGTATDFMYDIVGVPMAFTFEVCLLNFFLFFLLDFSVSLRLLVLTSRYMEMEQPHQEIASKCSIPSTLPPTMYAFTPFLPSVSYSFTLKFFYFYFFIINVFNLLLR